MKRALSIMLALVLLIGLVPIETAAAETKYATVVGGWLRLRAAPNFNAETITSYNTGTIVQVLGTSGGWCRVKAPDGNVGYMYNQYLVMNGGGESGGTGIGTATVVSHNGYGVRLRVGPGTGYRRIRTYPVGTTATVLERGTYWSRIRIGSTVGYMMNQFLHFGGVTPDPTENPNATIWSRNGYGVKLRSGPGKWYGVIGVYSVGTRVRVIDYGYEWSRIQVGSRIGYMMTEFLNIHKPTEITEVKLNTLKPVAGATIRVESITPAEANVTYEWIINKKVRSTDSSFFLKDDYIGHRITLKVIGKDGYTGTVEVTTEKIVKPLAITDVDLNNYTPAEGDTLFIASTEPADASYTCGWYYDDHTLAGSGSKYVVTADDVKSGRLICAKLTGKGLYEGETLISKAATTVKNATLNNVSVANLSLNEKNAEYVNAGQELRAVVEPNTKQVEYTWVFINTDNNMEERKLTGTDKRDITVPKLAGNYKITLTVKGLKGTPYEGQTIYNSPDLIITNKNRLVGISLKKSTSILAFGDSPTVLEASVTPFYPDTSKGSIPVNYSWYHKGEATPLPNGDKATYKVTANDIGKKIEVRASITDPKWTEEIVSKATDDVVMGCVNGAELQVSGSETTSFVLGDMVSVQLKTAAGITVPDDDVSIKWMVDGGVAAEGIYSDKFEVSKEYVSATRDDVPLKAEIKLAKPYYFIGDNPTVLGGKIAKDPSGELPDPKSNNEVEPVVIEEPAVTEEPVVTEEPAVTEEPEVTEAPLGAAEPGVKEEP